MHLNKFSNQSAYDAGIADVDFPAVSLVGEGIIYDKTKPGPTNYLKLSGTVFNTSRNGTVLEIGSGYDASTVNSDPPILYDENGNEISNFYFLYASSHGIEYYDNPDYYASTFKLIIWGPGSVQSTYTAPDQYRITYTV